MELMLGMSMLCSGTQVAQAEPAPSTAPAARDTPIWITWVCDVAYQPARRTWVRTLAMEVDTERVRAVRVDGQPVYSFQVHGTWVLTALDNERITFDSAQAMWKSDFRGQAEGQGRCEREDATTPAS